MNYKEEIRSLVDSLEKHHLDRRMIEAELFLSKGYIDQQISKEGNPKLVASLKMLLRLKDLEKAIEQQKNSPAQSNQANNFVEDILDRIEKKVDNVNLVVSDGYEHLLLTESLSRISLYHSAHMEARQFGGDYRQKAADLFAMTDEVYNKSRNAAPGDQKNKVA